MLKQEQFGLDQSVAVASPDAAFKNVISVDVEDYFHAEAFAATVDRSQWGSYESRVEPDTRRLLDLFSELELEATFFVLGSVAERCPQLVRDTAAAGHELACHSYWASPGVYQLDRSEFREDTHRAKETIEQIAGVPLRGCRAPTYSIVTRSLWAAEILVETGFTYDSSIFPIYHDRHGIGDAPRGPFHFDTPSGPRFEYPIATFWLCGECNLLFGGGGYLRLLPTWYMRFGMRRAQAETLPVIAYVHTWEIDPGQPRLNERLISRLRHYTNLGKTYRRLADMLDGGGVTSFRNSGLAGLAQAHTWGNYAR